jgi:hypothetical protein
MSINKKCFYKSVVTDYKRISLWIVALFALGAGGYIGYLVRAPIIAFLNTITGGTLFFMAGVALLILATIEDTRCSPSSAIATDTLREIIAIECVLFIVYLIMFMIVAATAAHPASSAEQNAWIYDIGFSFVVISAINVIITPINLAYSRCKVDDIEKPKKVVSQ